MKEPMMSIDFGFAEAAASYDTDLRRDGGGVKGRINMFVVHRHNILCGLSSVAQPEIYGGSVHRPYFRRPVGRKPAEGENFFPN